MVELKITLDPTTGGVNVTGPINDKILCLGLLELAKGIVQAHDPGKQPILLANRIPGLNGK